MKNMVSTGALGLETWWNHQLIMGQRAGDILLLFICIGLFYWIVFPLLLLFAEIFVACLPPEGEHARKDNEIQIQRNQEAIEEQDKLVA